MYPPPWKLISKPQMSPQYGNSLGIFQLSGSDKSGGFRSGHFGTWAALFV
jgi:hypothetical protein